MLTRAMLFLFCSVALRFHLHSHLDAARLRGLHSTAQYCTVLHSTAQYCTALQYLAFDSSIIVVPSRRPAITPVAAQCSSLTTAARRAAPHPYTSSCCCDVGLHCV